MKADLHIHSCRSRDSSVAVREIVQWAKALDLGCIAITDHNTLEGSTEARAIQGILVVPGMEVSSANGHILAYGISEEVPRGLGVEETVERIHDLGGLAVAAHPYRIWSGLGEENVLKAEFDAIETRNSRSTRGGNRKAASLAKRLETGVTGGSDAHVLEQVGAAVTLFPNECGTVDEVLDAIAKRETKVEGRSRGPADSLTYTIKCVSEWAARGFRRL
jgi:predicted metal-dependent phosphoesterase TrpH